MLFTTVQQTLLLAAASTLATAKNIKVQVGAGGLNYSPDTITADVGDVVDFTFTGKVHDVVSGPFGSPCQPATSGGFYSGFMQDASSSSVRSPLSPTLNETLTRVPHGYSTSMFPNLQHHNTLQLFYIN